MYFLIYVNPFFQLRECKEWAACSFIELQRPRVAKDYFVFTNHNGRSVKENPNPDVILGGRLATGPDKRTIYGIREMITGANPEFFPPGG